MVVQSPPPLRQGPLVLASTSAFRKELLARLGVQFVTADPGIDETPFKEQYEEPESLVCALSEAKARAVQSRYPQAWIIGSDQCAEINGRIFGKPTSLEAAVEQLMLLSGRTHRLITGLCVLDASTGRRDLHVDVHRMTLRRLSRRQAQLYVSRDRPIDCAGAYRIESAGIALFETIEGADYTAVIGLPLMRLASILSNQGFDVLSADEQDSPPSSIAP
jgi:septum formation protein